MFFYIDKIIVTGVGKKDSIIEFSKGVNIIYGPSNTGKTYIVRCLDYIFGSDRVPFDISTGYQHIKVVVLTDEGTITMSRKLGDSAIDVNSTIDRISSGRYAAKANRNKYNKTINFVWLSLIGINDMHLIISNENYKKQLLSWRTFYHMFLLTETKIISEYSAILSGRDTANTAVISSLIFLLSGKDFEETNTKDSKEIKNAKKNAVKSYINKELFRLSERNQELIDKLKDVSDIDVYKEIEIIMSRIEEYEKKLNISLKENQKILSCLHQSNEKLCECNVLLDRYNKLMTQYNSDLKRLSFIVDGEVNLNDTILSKCPFCDGDFTLNDTPDFIDAAKSDYKKIKLQVKDLEEAYKELILEKNTLEKEIEVLEEKKNLTEEIINAEIKPELDVLNDKLISYKMTIEYQKEIDVLKRISDQKIVDMIENESDDELNIKFKVREHLDFEFISELTDGIKELLIQSNYYNLLTVTFDKTNMDIIINGRKKGLNGKGYNAYYNSIVAIALARYMCNNAKYAPKFLVLDSPILSLKENASKKPSETMQYALFENIINNQEDIQTIIVENEIPDIDYGNTNLIHFTKEKDNGRYGFLLDVMD